MKRLRILKLSFWIGLIIICGGLFSSTVPFSERAGLLMDSGYNTEALFSNSLNFGLDLRDKLNQKITNPQEIESFNNLFVVSFYELLVNSELHSLAAALKILEETLDLAAKALTRDIQGTVRSAVQAILPLLERLKKWLIRCGSWAFSLTAILLLFGSIKVVPTIARTSLFVLRC